MNKQPATGEPTNEKMSFTRVWLEELCNVVQKFWASDGGLITVVMLGGLAACALVVWWLVLLVDGKWGWVTIQVVVTAITPFIGVATIKAHKRWAETQTDEQENTDGQN
jgi:hypothetical protein